MLPTSEWKAKWNAGVYPASNGVSLLYHVYLPANYSAEKKYPCILYMHSAGVRCDDNSAIFTPEAKFLRNLETGKYADEVIVVAPCCPKTAKWIPVETWKETKYDFTTTAPAPYMTATLELFRDCRAALAIDGTRLYTYGMSMGGFAVWDLLARNPEMFAAAIPVAGAGDPTAVGRMKNTAIWCFHGEKDGAVPVQSCYNMLDALKAAGRTDVKYTEFPGAGHGIWTLTADTEGLYDWLFAQKRG